MNIGGNDLLSQIENDSPKLGVYLRTYILPSIQQRGLPGHVLATPTDKPGPVELTPLASVQAAAGGGVNQIVPGANIAITPTNGKGTVTITASNTSGPPTGPAGGDLSGTYPNPTVAKVNAGAVPINSTYVGTNGTGQIVVAPTPASGANTFVVRNQVSDFLASANDAVFMNTSPGGHTVTLPPAASNPGSTIIAKKVSTDSQNLAVSPTGGDLLDGATSLVTNIPYQAYMFVSDGVSNWWLV